MSTILRALEKRKLAQSHAMPVFIEEERGRKWQAALLVALLMIIGLLAVVIYLLVKPVHGGQKELLFSPPVAALHSANQQTATIPLKKEEKPIRKISFALQPLPTAQIEEPAVDKVTAVNTQQSRALKEPEQIVVSGQKKELSAENIKEIDYGETSADLQQRFENALLISGIEDKEVVEPVAAEGDGSDLQQMSREFQEKVPAISYGSHIYSSVAKERSVRINDEDLREGQFDSSGKIQVVEIQAHRTIFRLGRQSFSLASLTDWPGY